MFKSSSSESTLTANQFVNVKDIRNNLIYTKDNYVLGFLRLLPINIDLLSFSEKRTSCNILASKFKGDKKPFSIFVISRTIDIEIYLDNLKERYERSMSNVIKRNLLKEMIREGSEKIMDGHNFEHQYYFCVWEKIKDNVGEEQASIEVHKRIEEVKQRYENIKNGSMIAENSDLIRLCNLFANGGSTVLEQYSSNEDYVIFPQLSEV